ncbi:MAG: tetratricopeptide repeat protein [Acidobacteriia bacterium]|nr:tetratricopeptide repeat protein [Terriglobia bacterium]
MRKMRLLMQYFSRLPFGFSSVCLFLCLTGCYSAKDYIGRGDRALADKKVAEALLDYQKAIQKNPQSVEAFHRIGTIQARLGNFAVAATNLERALQLTPSDDALRSELADAALSLYMTDPGRPTFRYEQVTKLSRELLAKNPKSFDGLRFEGSLLYVDNRVAEAIEVFRKANQVKPMMPAVILPLADALHKNGQDGEAESLATELIRRQKDYLPIYDWLYGVYQQKNRPSEAEAVLVQKVANNPGNSAAVLQLAAHYRAAKKPAEMAATLDRLIQQPKRFPDRFLLVGDFYTANRDWSEADRSFQTGIKEDAANALVYRKRLVAVYLGEQKRKEALDLLSQLIQQQGNDWESRAQRAEIWIQGKDKQEVLQAIAECQELVRVQPRDPRLKFLLGRAYFEKGDKDAAAQAFAQAAAQQRSFVDPRVALANIDRQRANYKETVRMADEILAIDPNNFEGKLLHASGSRGLGNLDQAQQELETLARQAPKSADVQLEIGLLTLARKQYTAAERVFTGLYQSGRSDVRALAALASTYLAEGQADRALQMVNGEVNRLPDSAEARELLAAIALNAGKQDIALEQYQKLTQMAPDSPKYFVALADLFRGKSDYANEVAALQKASKLAPENANVAGRLAIAEDFSGDKKEAAVEYKRSLDLAPSDPALLNNRAYFIAEDGGNLDDALAYSQAALRQLPNNPAVLDTLAWVYTKRKNNDSAIEILDKLVRQNPEVAAFHYHLGTALAQKGQTAKAKAELTMALNKASTPEEQAKIKGLMGKLQ